MNRLAALACLALVALPTLAHAEAEAPTRDSQSGRVTHLTIESMRTPWLRLGDPTPSAAQAPEALSPLAPAFGVHFDGATLRPAPAPVASTLRSDIPGIPVVVFKF